ncbi:HAMP domain-containing sensor histidine kinase [Streptomyces litchfieldiae]|uniref:histidine kinase n=1 Tax=Streptomyces litchfieldiae TaxID=3075543 RepID=A0ABU2N2E9_9ACTN|nr:HAMP domain-containing sensor histidine kinase [Streptomyces sp. DSM 44938]MDT0347213.1 HAMP domain-containing sensor histidine kinase [Streptomyces sp. DSM 44938]
MRDASEGRVRGWLRTLLRLTSLRLRLVTVFALVALVAAVSVSGIAYWLNRDAVLTRAQNSALSDFRKSLGEKATTLPEGATCDDLRVMAAAVANNTLDYDVVLVGEQDTGPICTAESDPSIFELDMVPDALVDAVHERRDDDSPAEYHLYWQRITLHGDPYLIGGTQVIGGGPTGYMLNSLAPERDDLNSLAWSLGIATALAVIGSILLAQAAATMVLRPVQRLSDAAQRLGEGELDTRLEVRGADELAELTRTFNRSAASLERRVKDLSAREAASRRFVADMSHELRTPMTAITAMTEVLEDEVDNLDPMIAPAVQLVVSETRRLNDLVENLMEVTRFDAGTARMVLDDVDIADQVTACIDARAWLDAVEVNADRGIIARLDPRRLDVILANLIGNALKHGGSPVRVTIREETTHDGARNVLLDVADQGPGIPEEVLPHVFDRFYKASASRPRSDGSGLGLSIALENAHLHGGDISARNAPGGGAVFTLRLPREAQPPEDETAGAERRESAPAEGEVR